MELNLMNIFCFITVYSLLIVFYIKFFPQFYDYAIKGICLVFQY